MAKVIGSTFATTTEVLSAMKSTMNLPLERSSQIGKELQGMSKATGSSSVAADVLGVSTALVVSDEDFPPLEQPAPKKEVQDVGKLIIRNSTD